MKIDWNDKNVVIAYAKKLGKGMTVFKHPDRRNFNITHTEVPKRYEGCEVVYQT